MQVVGPAIDPIDPDASALALHAAWAVDELHYLADIDRNYFTGQWRSIGYDPNSVDIAHVRWAAGRQ